MSQMTFGGDPANQQGASHQGQETANQDQGSSQQSFNQEPTQQQKDTLSSEELERIRKQNQHAQEHIKRLEDEAKAYRDMIAEYEGKVQESKTVEQLLEEMRTRQNAASSAGSNEEPTAPVVDVDKLVDTATERALEQLSAKERQQKEQENFNRAAEELRKAFGDRMNETVQSRAKELGLPIEKIDELARTSPTALVELVRGTKGAAHGSSAPSQSSVTGIPGGQQDDLARFAELRKSDPNRFYNQDVQKEYRKAIIAKAKKEGRL